MEHFPLHPLPGLDTAELGRTCLLFEELPSTNTFLKEKAGKFPHGAVVIARRQTAGRGRLGRAWAPAENKSLAMSVLLKRLSFEDLELFPLLAAVGVARALEKAAGVPVGIKWPNDIVAGGKKLCGILCESQILGESCCAVCGIGINLGQAGEDFQRLGLPHAVSLAMLGGRLAPLDAAAAILNSLGPVLEAGREETLEEYRGKCVTLGKQVRVTRDGEALEGRAADITRRGELLFDSGGEVSVIRSGDASVRGIYGYC